MVAPTFEDKLLEAVGEKIHLESVRGDTIVASVTGENLVDVVGTLRENLHARFMYSVGTDTREQNGNFAVNQVTALDRDRIFLVLRTDVDPAHAEIPSLTPMIPGANWHEREVRDMIGVEPVGHPDPRRLVLPDDFPLDVHPLRRDFNIEERPPRVDNPPLLRKPPKGTTLVPIGPFFQRSKSRCSSIYSYRANTSWTWITAASTPTAVWRNLATRT